MLYDHKLRDPVKIIDGEALFWVHVDNDDFDRTVIPRVDKTRRVGDRDHVLSGSSRARDCKGRMIGQKIEHKACKSRVEDVLFSRLKGDRVSSFRE